MSYTRLSPLTVTPAVAQSLAPEAIVAWLEAHAAAGASYVGLPQVPIPPSLGQSIVDWCLAYPLHITDAIRYIDPHIVAAQVHHESAVCQSKYARERFNYSGYGAVNHDPDQAMTFATPHEGIGMQVRHLLGYVAGDGPWNAAYEQAPRYHDHVKPAGWGGVVSQLWQLEQKWAFTAWAKYEATPLNERYGARLAAKAEALRVFANDGSWEPPMPDPQPGALTPPAGWTPPEIVRRILPRNASNTPQRLMVNWQYVTVHNTGNPNPGADALNHAAWLESLAAAGALEPSWGYTVDDMRIVQHLEDDQPGWHASDGGGDGNLNSLGFELVEIGNQEWVIWNAGWLIAEKLKGKGFGTDRMRQHHDWARDQKNCPRLLRANGGAGWKKLQAIVEHFLRADAPVPSPAIPPSTPDPHGSPFWVLDVFSEEISRYPWIVTGVCLGGAYGMDGMICQDFERCRLELHADNTIHRALVNVELLACRLRLAECEGDG